MSESFAAPGAQKKQLLILGTVVGVVALAVALFVMMLGGGSGTPGSILAANAAAKSSATAASGPGAYVIPSEYAGNIGHDPFKPVVVEKSGGVGGSGAATHGAAPSSSATASPSPTKTPVVTLTPTPSPTVVILTVTPTATVTVTPSPTGLPTCLDQPDADAGLPWIPRRTLPTCRSWRTARRRLHTVQNGRSSAPIGPVSILTGLDDHAAGTRRRLPPVR